MTLKFRCFIDVLYPVMRAVEPVSCAEEEAAEVWQLLHRQPVVLQREDR